MALIEVKVPDIGDFKEVEVIEVLVKQGDSISKEQSLLTVESDKASMEIPSSASGIVKDLRVKLGDKVSEGTLILLAEAADPQTSNIPSKDISPNSEAPVGTKMLEEAQKTSALPEKSNSDSKPSSVSLESQAEQTVFVPDIGDFQEVEVIEVMVKPGDTIKAEQSLITVESDKASMEIPSCAAGVVKSVLVKLGDKVSMGTPLITLATASSPAASKAPSPAEISMATPAAPPAQAERRHPVPEEMRAATDKDRTKPHASPSVRAYARELGVDIARVPGTGPKERITQDDVRNYVKAAVAAVAADTSPGRAGTISTATAGASLNLIDWPKIDFAKFGEIQTQPLSRIKKISGANLHRNWVMIPHVTNHEDADITELEALRLKLNEENAKAGIKVTLLAFLIKAAVAALKKFPEFNASLEGENLILKKYFHIGFAADTPNGLMVPVIKDADKKGVFEIGKEMSELAAKAREGKLSPAEMSGGCFSISSLGGIGGTYFTPIINAPEVAILGVCRSSTRPVWNGKEFEPRLILPLSLSWDHRVIDGASAARFNSYLASILADFRRVIL